MALIFYLSSHPAPKLAMAFPTWLGVKLLHVIEYGGLALLLNFGLFKGTRWPPRNVYVWTFLIAVGYGMSDEFHQSLVTERNAAVPDVIADAIGAFIFVALHPRVADRGCFRCLRFRAGPDHRAQR